METLKIAFKCGYCNKLYQLKHYCTKHELACSDNPVNDRICFICCELQMKDKTFPYDSYCGEENRVVSVFYCKAKDIFLYPPKVERKKNWFDFGDIENEPMKKECDEFNQ